MVRLIALILLSLIFVSPSMADETKSRDPKHPGFTRTGSGTVSPVYWQELGAACTECETLAKTYNNVMAEVFYLRYQIASIEASQKTIGTFISDAKFGQSMTAHKGLSDVQQEGVAMAMNALEEYQILEDQIPVLKAQLDNLEALGDDLRNELENCEATKCTGDQKQPPREVTGGNVKVSGVLPFDWRGPYPEVCTKCAKLAARLNELPTLARKAISEIEIAKSEIAQADAAMARYRAAHTAFVAGQANPDVTDKELEKLNTEYDASRIGDYEKRKKAAEAKMRGAQQDLDGIKRNFDQTLDLYSKCTPTCPKETGMSDPPKDDDTALVLGGDYSKDLKGCTLSYTPDPIIIGSNSQYGTGAAMKDKVKGAATGAAMNALGGLLGGGGISLGGGGDKGGGMQQIDEPGSPGGGQQGPDLDSNPIKGAPTSQYKWEGLDIRAQVDWTKDGLVVNQEIKDSPDGNSTFHSMWLENPKGEKVLPSRYYVYSIYMDHKLTVWWTYDHWTNGVHDDHDEGEEVSTWRTYHGDFYKKYAGESGVPNSMWYQSGYNTAVKGVKHAGALFPISPGDLTGCGAFLTTHYTLPSADPVKTQPMVLHLFNDVPADTKYDALGKKVPVGMELFKF